MRVVLFIFIWFCYTNTIGQNHSKEQSYRRAKKRFYTDDSFVNTVYFGNYHSYSDNPTLMLEEVLEVDSLILADKHDYQKTSNELKVKSFSVLYIEKGKMVKLLSNNNKVTTEMKEKFSELKDVENLIFEEIVVVSDTGEEFKYGSILIKIIKAD